KGDSGARNDFRSATAWGVADMGHLLPEWGRAWYGRRHRVCAPVADKARPSPQRVLPSDAIPATPRWRHSIRHDDEKRSVGRMKWRPRQGPTPGDQDPTPSRRPITPRGALRILLYGKRLSTPP